MVGACVSGRAVVSVCRIDPISEGLVRESRRLIVRSRAVVERARQHCDTGELAAGRAARLLACSRERLRTGREMEFGPGADAGLRPRGGG